MEKEFLVRVFPTLYTSENLPWKIISLCAPILGSFLNSEIRFPGYSRIAVTSFFFWICNKNAEPENIMLSFLFFFFTLPGKSHGWRSLVSCSPWGLEESDTTERLHFHFHALEKEMAAHSSVLAWRIPETAEPGGLPSMGLHRVGHNWSDLNGNYGPKGGMCLISLIFPNLSPMWLS